MLAFHAPPVAVIMPVTRYGKIPGRIRVRHRRHPVTWYTTAASRRSDGIDMAPAITLNSTYHCVPRSISRTEAMLRPPGMDSRTTNRIGNTLFAGTDAATCTSGCARYDHFGLKPMATPAGIVHAAAIANAITVRVSVAPALSHTCAHCPPGSPASSWIVATTPQRTSATPTPINPHRAALRPPRRYVAGNVNRRVLAAAFPNVRSSHSQTGRQTWRFIHSMSADPWSSSTTREDGASAAPDCSNLNRSDQTTSGRHKN